LLSGVAGGIGYHLLMGDPFEVLPLCAVGSLAGFIYILRMNSSGSTSFKKARSLGSKCARYWCAGSRLLALIAFLLKISAAYSRGAFVIFYVSRQ
jgi:hypothetical protein